jgi:hypothetical protein
VRIICSLSAVLFPSMIERLVFSQQMNPQLSWFLFPFENVRSASIRSRSVACSHRVGRSNQESCVQQGDHLLSQQEFSSICILHIVIIVCIRILKSRSISIQYGALRHRKLKHMHTCVKPDWIISPAEADHFSTSVLHVCSGCS